MQGGKYRVVTIVIVNCTKKEQKECSNQPNK